MHFHRILYISVLPSCTYASLQITVTKYAWRKARTGWRRSWCGGGEATGSDVPRKGFFGRARRRKLHRIRDRDSRWTRARICHRRNTHTRRAPDRRLPSSVISRSIGQAFSDHPRWRDDRRWRARARTHGRRSLLCVMSE